jgi:hypothetical protein
VRAVPEPALAGELEDLGEDVVERGRVTHETDRAQPGGVDEAGAVGQLDLRVTAAVEFLAAVGDADDPIHQIFRIAHGQAFIWGMSDILKERELPRAVF